MRPGKVPRIEAKTVENRHPSTQCTARDHPSGSGANDSEVRLQSQARIYSGSATLSSCLP